MGTFFATTQGRELASQLLEALSSGNLLCNCLRDGNLHERQDQIPDFAGSANWPTYLPELTDYWPSSPDKIKTMKSNSDNFTSSLLLSVYISFVGLFVIVTFILLSMDAS